MKPISSVIKSGLICGTALVASAASSWAADIDYSRYRFYEDEDRDYLFSSIFGFNWRPKKNIMAGLELQDVNNDVLSKDWRLMLKFSLNHRKVF